LEECQWAEDIVGLPGRSKLSTGIAQPFLSEPEAIFKAAQRAVLRHDRHDKAHLGRTAKELHPNHAAFVKELKEEARELKASKNPRPAFALQFIEESFNDVILYVTSSLFFES
jgi:hypothetical protein